MFRTTFPRVFVAGGQLRNAGHATPLQSLINIEIEGAMSCFVEKSLVLSSP